MQTSETGSAASTRASFVERLGRGIVRLGGRQLSRAQAHVFLGLYGTFTLLTLILCSFGIDDGPDHVGQVIATTLATIAGPMTGSVAREGQSCCTAFSLSLLWICAPPLLTSLLVQHFSTSRTKLASRLRMALWVCAWFLWFAGGILSFGHALS